MTGGPTGAATGAPPPGLAAATHWARRGDRVYDAITRVGALAVIVVVAGLVVGMGHAARPAIRAFGWRFLVGSTWDPVAERFGALPFVYGTVVSSTLALALAV
ncbi:MAG TPA: phosphate ABC transporter permease subunit PstC, partial [Methylomirabilota bacterium]|nr:phosphate ABC transporter permease subunit PstC [Methylomirabilota bacterium]